MAGTSEAKSVSIFANLAFGQELLRFPVSQFATSIRGGGGDTFLLGIGAGTPGARGAVESWNVRGQMTATIPMPAAVIQLSKVDHGIIYALIANAEKRAAVRLNLDALTTGHVVPLPAAVTALDQCALLGVRYLVTVGPSHRVQFVNASTDTVTSSSIQLDGVSCIGANVLLGLGDDGLGRSVQIVRLSRTAQRSEALHAPGDAVAAVPDERGRVLILRKMGSDSNIQIWTREELANIFAPAAAQLAVPPKLSFDPAGSVAENEEFRYFGRWDRIRDLNGSPSAKSSLSERRGSLSVLRFSGKRIRLYGVLGRTGGYAGAFIDGDADPEPIDFYAPSKQVHRLVYDSGALTPGPHQLAIVVMGLHQSRSSGNYVNLDDAAIESAQRSP